MKYYLITCMQGHHGRGRHAEITFAMMAQNLIEAQDKAKRMPSVKHSRGILMGREITEEEYYERRKISAYDRIYGGK